ncbi:MULTISPECIES: DUF4386 domain-containing protein [unclassified Lentimicrobium]|uniref:DUF4386 domain-containing protein n=1 Tax=unclassified Lentimicrobium TaxID=2677434 RepID=UPI001551A155|nr:MULTISPECIES: DUF4386 domain-containing protein [unclassified Lentimicrobium]NPD46129.1 DUF4386 domain-containing protein [Lentimicrobium sp. S6]NPD86479.1 DUF4386 domain-containing protein [Lentimicrobium sp. L6]
MKKSNLYTEGVELQKTVKVAGIAYLLIIIVPLLSMLIIEPIITVSGDIVATINNIIANEVWYRVDTTITLLMYVGVVLLSLSLYTILKPVNKQLAQLALLWRFAEALVGIFATLSSFILLLFIKGENNIEKFGTDQFYALAEFIHGIHWEVTVSIFVLLALGSIIVFYLFLKSKLIPKALSIWGIISYSLVLIGALISLIFSGNTYMILGSQTILFEIVIGCWLLFKGLNISNN